MRIAIVLMMLLAGQVHAGLASRGLAAVRANMSSYPSGAISRWQPAKTGNALDTIGTNDLVACGDASVESSGFYIPSGSTSSVFSVQSINTLAVTGAFTFVTWVKTDLPGGINFLAGKYNHVTAQRGWLLGYDYSSSAYGHLNFSVSKYESTFTGGGRVYTTAAQITNEWFHIAAVFNPSTEEKIYVNGVDETDGIDVGSIPSSVAAPSVSFTVGSSHYGDVFIGATGNKYMDDVGFFSEALTAETIKKLYDSQKTAYE